MHELYELKDSLMEELEEYGSKEMSTGSLEVVDKLTHTIKNLDKIIEKCEEEEYSNASYGSYEGGNMGGGSNRGSYARGGRSQRGSYARGGRSYARRRDSRGRYSRNYSGDEEMVSELRMLMEEAPDERTRQEFQKFISKIEKM